MDQSTRNSRSQGASAYPDVRPDQSETDEMIRGIEERFACCDTRAKVGITLTTAPLICSPDHDVKAQASTMGLPASIVSSQVSLYVADDDVSEELDPTHDETDHDASLPLPLKAEMVKQVVPEPHHYLGRESLLKLRNGWLFANHIGYPLNTMVTINWRSANGFVPKAWAHNKKVEDRVFHSFQTFLGERDLPLAYVWAMENLAVGGWGPHTHMLIHLPADQQKTLMKKLQHRLMRAGGFREENAVDIRESHAENREGGLTYICKAAFPLEVVSYRGEQIHLGDLPNLQHPLAPQGRVPRWKRASTSHLLGKIARRSAGWTEVDNLLWLSETAPDHETWYRVAPKLRRITDARKQAAETPPLIH